MIAAVYVVLDEIWKDSVAINSPYIVLLVITSIFVCQRRTSRIDNFTLWSKLNEINSSLLVPVLLWLEACKSDLFPVSFLRCYVVAQITNQITLLHRKVSFFLRK